MTLEFPGPAPQFLRRMLGCVLLGIAGLTWAGCDILESDLTEVPVARIRHGGAVQDRHYAAPFQDVKEALLGSLRGLAFTIESSESREKKGLEAFVVSAHRREVTQASIVVKANVSGDVLVSIEVMPSMQDLATEIQEELTRRLPEPMPVKQGAAPPRP